MEWLGIIICYSYVLGLLIIAHYLQRYGKEVSRKFVHILTANWWFIAMIIFDDYINMLIVATSFLIVNIMTSKYHIIKSIERDNSYRDLGNIYYALGTMMLVVVSLLYNNFYIGFLGMFIMGYGDGLAALIGKRWAYKCYVIKNNNKSLVGSLTMFLVSFFIAYMTLLYQGGSSHVLASVLIAGGATLAEAVSLEGMDNLFIPLSVSVIYIVLCL